MISRFASKEALQLAIQLDFFLGFLGLFGLGEIYLGKKYRGAGFLLLSGVLYVCIVGVVTVPSLAWVLGYLPTAWGLGFCLLLCDIFSVTDRLDDAGASA